MKTNPILGGPAVATRPDDTPALVAPSEIREQRCKVFLPDRRHGETAIVVRAPFGGRVAEVAEPEVFAVSVPQSLRIGGRQFFQRFRSLGGEGQQAWNGCFDGLAAGLFRRRLENRMRICATEAEGVDAGNGQMIRGLPRFQLGYHAQPVSVEVDGAVWLVKMQGRRNLPVAQR